MNPEPNPNSPEHKPPWWKREVVSIEIKSKRFTPEVNEAINANVAMQVILIFFCGGMILDGGLCAMILLAAAAAYWIAAIPILARRPKTTRKGELFFLRFGWVILIPASLFSIPAWGWLRELLKWN